MDIRAALESYRNQKPIKLKAAIPGLDETVYYRPMTLGDNDSILAKMNRQNIDPSRQGAQVAVTVVHKLLDVQGKPIFNLTDVDWMLKSVPLALMTDIATEVGTVETIEEVEKK